MQTEPNKPAVSDPRPSFYVAMLQEAYALDQSTPEGAFYKAHRLARVRTALTKDIKALNEIHEGKKAE